MLVDVVQACAALEPDERRKVGASTIAQQCRQDIEGELAQPRRSPDDWSIFEFEASSCCDDCATLAAFLTDPDAQEITWAFACRAVTAGPARNGPYRLFR